MTHRCPHDLYQCTECDEARWNRKFAVVCFAVIVAVVIAAIVYWQLVGGK